MKVAAATFALFVVCFVGAADSPAVRFGGERIRIPPLSLADSIAQRAEKPLFAPGTKGVPATDSSRGEAFSDKLLPRSSLDLPTRRTSAREASPLQSGMPILTPRRSVEYSLSVVPPRQDLDLKMIVKEPAVSGRPTPQRE